MRRVMGSVFFMLMVSGSVAAQAPTAAQAVQEIRTLLADLNSALKAQSKRLEQVNSGDEAVAILQGLKARMSRFMADGKALEAKYKGLSDVFEASEPPAELQDTMQDLQTTVGQFVEVAKALEERFGQDQRIMEAFSQALGELGAGESSTEPAENSTD